MKMRMEIGLNKNLNMKDMTIQENKIPNTFELFKQFIECKFPVDAWLDSIPEDSDGWRVECELIDHSEKIQYRCLTRFYNLEHDFVINAVIESTIIHD